MTKRPHTDSNPVPCIEPIGAEHNVAAKENTMKQLTLKFAASVHESFHPDARLSGLRKKRGIPSEKGLDKDADAAYEYLIRANSLPIMVDIRR